MKPHYCASLILVAVVFTTGSAFAQTKFELFAGYSPLRDIADDATLQGWNGSLTTNIKPWIGITVDFSGHYDGRRVFIASLQFAEFGTQKFMTHRGMVGPQVKLRHGRWEPFGQALFGVNRVSAKRSPITFVFQETDFAWALGGGLDLKVSQRISIRLIQADYMRSRTLITHETLQASFGLVFSF